MPTEHRYANEHPDQFFRLHLPTSSLAGHAQVSPLPVAIVIHGGFWKDRWNVDNAAISSLAPDLASAASPGRPSYAAVEVEYRRRDAPGGGFPGTLHDVERCLQAVAALAETQPLDLERIVLIGHSAGGQLALWLAQRAAKSQAAESGARLPVPKLVVGLAPVADMVSGYERKLSDDGDAVERFMKCKPDSDTNLSKYHRASPRHQLPALVPSLLVAGLRDTDVPEDYVREYCLAADRCDGNASVTLLTIAGADHYALVDASSDAWRAARAFIDCQLGEAT